MASSTASQPSPLLSAIEQQLQQHQPKERKRAVQFPWKLHQLLEKTEQNGDASIISWLPDGKSFKVHKKEAFCDRIMPIFFNSSKYKTFQRSLNLWGFESVTRGPNRGSCFHPRFERGQPELCQHMTRVKIKGRNARNSNMVPPIEKTIADATIHASTSDESSPSMLARPSSTSLSALALSVKLGTMNRGRSRLLRQPSISDFIRSSSQTKEEQSLAEIDAEIESLVRRRASLSALSGIYGSSNSPAAAAAFFHPSTSLRRSLPSLATNPFIFGRPNLHSNPVLNAISAANSALELLQQSTDEVAGLPRHAYA